MVRARRAWVAAHRWLGLGVGAAFALLGVTGSILVFDHAIDEWLNPELLTTEPAGAHRRLDEIVAAARRVLPDRTPTFLSMPRQARGVVVIEFETPAGGPAAEVIQVMVDPYTARVLGRRDRHAHLMAVVYDLHYRLLLDHGGMTVVGLVGVLLTVSLVSGLVAWWPARGGRVRWPRVRHAVRVKWTGGARRVNFDLHRTVGVVSVLVLSAVAITGVAMCFSEEVEAMVAAIATVTPDPDVRSAPRGPGAPISVQQAVEAGTRLFPAAALKGLVLPAAPDDVYQVVLRQPHEVRRSWGRTRVWVDQYSGRVLAVRDSSRSTAGDLVLDWQFPLHNGEAFGLPGRWIVAVSGVSPLALAVTGTVIWWGRRRGIRAVGARRTAAANSGGR